MAQETKNSILIIGGGLLGLSIAYEFSRNNFKVLVSSKTEMNQLDLLLQEC